MKIEKNTFSIRGFIFIIIIYVYIYNPIFQFIGFGSIKLLLLVSTLYILLWKKINVLFINFYKELVFTLILIVYSLLVEVFSGPAGLLMAYSHLIWFLEGFIIPMFILLVFKDFFIKHDFKNIFISIGFIASCITLFLILNPELNSQIRSSLIMDPLDTFSDHWTFRGFTIAEGSSFSYGVVQGIIVGFCLFQIKKSFLYTIPIITLFISIIFNARIGMVVVLIAIILLVLINKIKFKRFLIPALIIIVFINILLESSFSSSNSKSLEWGFHIFTETIDFFNGTGETNTYSVLFGDMFFFPKNTNEFLFGTGEDIFLNIKRSSDVGYVLQIFKGGIFYLIILLFFLILMYRRVRRIDHDKFLPIFFILVILIANIKGDSLFLSGGFFRLFTLYYVYEILLIKEKKNNFNSVQTQVS